MIAEFIGGRGSIGIMVMGGLIIAVMSYLFIDESRRGDPVLFRPASLIAAYLALLKTPGVMFHGLTIGLAVGMFFAMGVAMPYAFDRMGIGPLEYGLLTPLLLSFLCFSFGVCNGLVIANAMICSMRAPPDATAVRVPAFWGNANAIWWGRGKRNHCAWRRRLF